MKLIKKILRWMWPRQQSVKTVPKTQEIHVLLRTNKKGIVELVDSNTGNIITGIKKARFYIDIMKRPCLEIQFKKVDLDILIDNVEIENENTT